MLGVFGALLYVAHADLIALIGACGLPGGVAEQLDLVWVAAGEVDGGQDRLVGPGHVQRARRQPQRLGHRDVGEQTYLDEVGALTEGRRLWDCAQH
ncbi:MAG: hypothetical protein ACR2FG_00045 [Marmoricola sp.]